MSQVKYCRMPHTVPCETAAYRNPCQITNRVCMHACKQQPRCEHVNISSPSLPPSLLDANVTLLASQMSEMKVGQLCGHSCFKIATSTYSGSSTYVRIRVAAHGRKNHTQQHANVVSNIGSNHTDTRRPYNSYPSGPPKQKKQVPYYIRSI